MHIRAAAATVEHSTHKHRSDTSERNSSVAKYIEIAHGRICEIHPEKGLGRIETQDGRVIIFYKDSVVDRPFEGLATGTEVRFAEESSEHGPRASVVHIID
jgi:cold shock CspA family protein